MTREISFEDLWNSALSGGQGLGPAQLEGLPDNVQRYLQHAIAPGAPLAAAVRLKMRGEIRLKDWFPFKAEQILCRGGDMIWRATVRMHGMPIRGEDRLIDGAGRMRWKLFGLIPILRASGPDIDRSSAGRVGCESIWLPSALCADKVAWSASDDARAHAKLATPGEPTNLTLCIDPKGRLEQVLTERWGNPGGGPFHYASFGAMIDDEASFDGYTIPSRLRVGWHPNGRRFDGDGEFFRVTIDHAQFR